MNSLRLRWGRWAFSLFAIACAMSLLAIPVHGCLRAGIAYADESEETGSSTTGADDQTDENAADTSAGTAADGQSAETTASQETEMPSNISITGLANASPLLDGTTVVFSGEVVGDAVRGEDGKEWLTLYDSESSVPVYVDEDDVALVSNFGAYGVKGTTLQVTGVYHINCELHQGEADVHAIAVSLVDPGEVESNVYDPRYLYFGLLATGFAGLLLLLYYMLRRRLR